MTAADKTATEVVNTATVSGDDENGVAQPTASDTETTNVSDVQGELLKSAALDTVFIEGATITYTFELENTGFVPITAADLDDATLGISDLSFPAGDFPLAVGATSTLTHTHTIAAAEETAGGISNVASADITNGTDNATIQSVNEAGGTPGTPTVLSVIPPLLQLEKASAPNLSNPVQAGDTIDYTLTVTEINGGTDAENVVINDPLLGSFSIGAVVAGGTATSGPHTYTLTQADADRGYVANTAEATYDYQGDARPPSYDTEIVTYPLPSLAGLSGCLEANVIGVRVGGPAGVQRRRFSLRHPCRS